MSVRGLMGWVNPQHLLKMAFRFRPNSEFILFQGARLTRRQVMAQIEALAAGLQALGMQKGDRVATLLPACPEGVYTLFLPWVLGNINVPLNPLLGEYELRHILADCGAKVVIVRQSWLGMDHPAMLGRMLADLPELRHIILCGATDGDGRTYLPWSDVVSGDKPLRRPNLSPRDPMTIAYTSGTSGMPKGVLHTRGRAVGVLARGAQSRLSVAALRCLLLPYPLHNTSGRFGVFVSLVAGGKVILMDRPDPCQMLEYIQRERVTQIGGSPTMYRLLLSTPGQERYDLSSVRRVAFSSEPLSLELARALHERLGCHLENFYGTTETMAVTWTGMNDSWETVANTVGRPCPGVRVRIVDEARRPLPLGERGEVAVQTPQMMSGYYRAPELTAQVLDAEGWFYTGDIGYLGEDGYLRLVDRKSDLIIRGGQNIYPAEVEQYLQQHPAIRRAAVVGAPHKMSGEAVWAYLELKPGAALSAPEVLDFCRGRIAPFKIPSQIRFVEHLPTNAVGKVQRFKLRERAAQEAASLAESAREERAILAEEHDVTP